MRIFYQSSAISQTLCAAILLAGVVALTAATPILGQTAPVAPDTLASAGVATPLPACSCINDVIQRVNALPLKRNQHNALVTTLIKAGYRISRCGVVKAGQLMVRFVTQTQRLVRQGALDQSTAESLASCAQSIRLCGLECTSSAANSPPVALAKPVVVSADANCQANPPAAAFDNGSYAPNGMIVNRSVTPPGPYPLGQTVVTYTVVDNQGVSSSVSATVLVQDTAGPSVSNFSPNFIVAVAQGQNSGTAIFPIPTVSGGCAGVAEVSFVPPSGSVFPVGVTPAALVVVDGMGTTHQFGFNVVVLPNSGGGGGGGGGNGTNLLPVAIAHAVTNSPSANCQGGVTAAQVDNHSFSPNPGGRIVSESVEPAGPFPFGSTTPVTLTVVDNLGQSNSTVTTVTVLNLNPPTLLTPPENIAVMPALGQPSVVVNYPTLSVTDACSSAGIGVSYAPPSGTAFGLGTNTVTCWAYNEAGTNTTTFRVIVTAFNPSACDLPGLIQEVQEIPLLGSFNGGRKKTMVQKLEQAQLDISQRYFTSAHYLLGGFVVICRTYQQVHILSALTTGPLIGCATNIQNVIATMK